MRLHAFSRIGVIQAFVPQSFWEALFLTNFQGQWPAGLIALVYVLFAVMAKAPRTILVESTMAAAFVGVAAAGTRWANLRAAGLLMAAGLAAHGVYDLVHAAVVSNPVVPQWWPLFCGVVDLLLGGWVLLLGRRKLLTGAPEESLSRLSR